MKLEITNALIKELEKRFKKHVPYVNDIVSINRVELDFDFDYPNTCYIIEIGWGHNKDTSREEEWHNKDLFISEKNISLDFIEGKFAQLVEDLGEYLDVN